MPKLTVIILCKNERMNIRPCIESARPFADEILVADSGSTDGTMDIVRDIGGCRLVERQYIHYGDFANWAIAQASHDWVMILDADERVSPELATNIQQAMAVEPAVDGFRFRRVNYFMGHLVRRCGWDRDYIMRLFRREVGGYVGDTDHACPQVSTNKIGTIEGTFHHYSYWTYDHYFQKYHRYTSFQAQQWHKQGRRPSTLAMLLTPLLTFIKYYVFNLGFLDGAVGIQVCWITAFYSFGKQARLWELHCAHQQPDPEKNHALKVGRVSNTSTDRAIHECAVQPSIQPATTRRSRAMNGIQSRPTIR